MQKKKIFKYVKPKSKNFKKTETLLDGCVVTFRARLEG